VTPADPQTAIDGETGFGLIEIIVSMFLLALLSMAFLPLVVQAYLTSAKNMTVATATQLVSQQIDQARSAGSTCSNLTNFASTAVSPVYDRRNVRLQAYRSVGACPATYPGTIAFTVYVTRDGSTAHLAEAKTLIYLTGN